MRPCCLFGLLAAVTATALCLGGCQPTQPAGDQMMAASHPANLVCPITGNMVSKDAPTRTFAGKTVAFCCPMCPAAWDKLSDADKKAKWDAAMAKQMSMVVNAKCPIEGGAVSKDVEMRAYNGKVVGFCCPMCPPTWDKLSDADKKAKLDLAMKAK